MKSYLYYFKLRIITNLQYRSAALAGISTQLFFGFVYIMFYIALYESNNDINIMKQSELITYLWLQQSFYALTYPFIKDKELLSMISDGNLAYELVRPQNFYLKFYIKMIADRFISVIMRFLPIIIIGFILPFPYKLSLPYSFENFILFILSLILSCLLISALCIIIHIITMFTIDSRGITSIYSVISELFMGSLIPLPFLPKWLYRIGLFLPFRYICDFPYRVYSNSIPINEGIKLLVLTCIWLFISNILGILLSKLAMKKAVIQGG